MEAHLWVVSCRVFPKVSAWKKKNKKKKEKKKIRDGGAPVGRVAPCRRRAPCAPKRHLCEDSLAFRGGVGGLRCAT